MIDVLPLIRERDDHSKKILKIIEEPLNKALQYFMKDGRIVKWLGIDLIGEDKFAYISGQTSPIVGETVSQGGVKFIADEKYVAENPVNEIRVMLPIVVIERADPEEIFEHLKIYSELNSLIGQEEIIALIYSLKIENLSDILKNLAVVDKITRPKEFEGFNVENLTDYQISQIRYFTETTSKIKN